MTIDTKAIRAAAEAAKGLPDGDWNYEPRGQTVWNGRKHMVCDIRGWGHLQYLPEGAELQDAMGRHIANLNPVAVLALLDRLEAAEKALAEPAVEPVAYRYKYLNFMGGEVWSQDMPRNGKVLETQALYTSPPPPAEVPLLTAYELEALEVRERPANGPKSTLNFARAIEHAVRQKAGLP